MLNKDTTLNAILEASKIIETRLKTEFINTRVKQAQVLNDFLREHRDLINP